MTDEEILKGGVSIEMVHHAYNADRIRSMTSMRYMLQLSEEQIAKRKLEEYMSPKDIYTDISQFTHFPDWAIQRVLNKLDEFQATKVIFVAPKGMFIRGTWDVPMFDSAGINLNELRAFALLHGFALPRHVGVAV